MKYKLLMTLLLAGVQHVDGQNVFIPDVQFKNYLVNNAGININGDTEIQVAEATAYSSGIWVSGLNISDLTGIGAFVNATNLNCSNNALTTLDLSSNVSLTQVNANDNQLTQLNLANGANTNIGLGWFSATNNAGLTCIQVDDVSYSTSNWSAIDAQSSYSTNCNYPCNVTIPDANFKAYLLGNAAINTNGDTEIQCSEANAFTGTIDCPSMSISDLTGIEQFTGLTYLFCHVNQLTTLNLSANTALISLKANSNQLTSLYLPSGSALQFLDCSMNSLTAIDINQNSGLVSLDCFDNQLTALDVSTNTGLSTIHCYDNQLTSLDVTPIISLVTLTADNNQLTSLNVSSNPALQTLDCSDNSITNLDVSSNIFLTNLYCADNAISTLDLNQNDELVELVCSINQLTSLDVSSNGNLTRVACTDNLLTELNVANGNNTNFNSNLFYATNNSNLTCIEVDDAVYSTANWLNIDAQASFDTACVNTASLDGLNLLDISIYPNPAKDVIHLMANDLEIEQIKIMDASGKVFLSVQNPEKEMPIDVSMLAKGIYLFEITTTNQVLNKSFVKD